MAAVSLEIPPLLMPDALDCAGRRPGLTHAGPVALWLDEIAPLARRAVAEAVRPFALSKATQVQEARSVAAANLQVFLGYRRQVWGALALLVSQHPLEVPRLIADSLQALKSERRHWSLEISLESAACQSAWWSLQAAVDTYELTMRLLTDNFERCLLAVTSGRVPPTFQDFQAHLADFRAQLGTATGTLEFGLLAVRELRDSHMALSGATFEVACALASCGADEQHVLMRQALRALVIEGEPGLEPVGEGPSAQTPFALFADWVRGSLAR